MSVVEYLVNSLLGICVVFFALALLIAIIVIMSKLNLSDEPKKAKGAAAAISSCTTPTRVMQPWLWPSLPTSFKSRSTSCASSRSAKSRPRKTRRGELL